MSPRPQIGIDVTGLFGEYRTGVQNYYYGLMEGLWALDMTDELPAIGLVDRNSTESRKRLLEHTVGNVGYRHATPLAWVPRASANAGNGRLAAVAGSVWNRVLTSSRSRIAKVRRLDTRILKDLDVYQVWNWDIRVAPRARHVVVVHDIIPILLPDLFPAEFIRATEAMIAFATQKADAVIAVSDYTKNELVTKASVPAQKIRVVNYGLARMFRPVSNGDHRKAVLRKYGLDSGPYVLSVGFLDPRKNVGGHIEAFEKLVRRGGCDPKLRLALVGPRAYRAEWIDREFKKCGVRERIQIVGYVPHRELPCVYSGAEALLYCSLYEGFGMPVVEAMGCGTPVVTSNSGCLPEAAGDSAFLVDPNSPEEISRALERVLCDGAVRDELRRKGLARAAEFCWKKCARNHLDVYMETYRAG